MKMEEREGRVQRNRRGEAEEREFLKLWGVERGGSSFGYPGDRKCLLPVASCPHFSICLPPAGPHPSHSDITFSWGWELATPKAQEPGQLQGEAGDPERLCCLRVGKGAASENLVTALRLQKSERVTNWK